MMAAPVAKTVIRRSADFQEEINPATAASTTAGPTAFIGSTAYIIAARKMKASAIDFSLWLTPSPLVTETVKRLAASVKINNPTNGSNPVQPVRGKPTTETRERTNSTEASAATQPRSARVFQFPSGIAKIVTSWKMKGSCLVNVT
jgi:hypothetical protein